MLKGMLDLSLGQKLFPVKSVLQNPIQSCTKNPVQKIAETKMLKTGM